MLPEVLLILLSASQEEKIHFSAFEISEKAEVINQWFGRTVIFSDQRFAYEEAQYIRDQR
jgi:ribonuclease R